MSLYLDEGLKHGRGHRAVARNRGILVFYEKGYSMREIAKEFDVSLERVRQILRRDAPHLIRPRGDNGQHSSGMYPAMRKRLGLVR